MRIISEFGRRRHFLEKGECHSWGYLAQANVHVQLSVTLHLKHRWSKEMVDGSVEKRISWAAAETRMIAGRMPPRE